MSERNHSGCDGDGRTARRAAGCQRYIEGIARWSAQAICTDRAKTEFRRVGLANDDGACLPKPSYDEFVLVRDIEVWSCCEHHLVPFTGKAHIGYIPNENGRITGLSKLARLVDLYAKRPQVQERLTTQVADAMMSILEARGAIVVIEAEHLCMTMRGVRKPGSKTVTSAVRGSMHNAATRSEAMSLIMHSAR